MPSETLYQLRNRPILDSSDAKDVIINKVERDVNWLRSNT